MVSPRVAPITDALVAIPPLALASNGSFTLPVLHIFQFPPPPAYDWHTQIIDGILNIWAPNPGDFGTTWTVTDPTALFGSDAVPNIQGVHQTVVPDCYLFSAGASMALTHPSQIMSVVKQDVGGGWIVTFQSYSNGAYIPVRFHTDNELSVSLQSPANGEVWPLVIEKAYAAFRTWNGVSSTNTLASISWGYPNSALMALGEASQKTYYSSLTDQAFYNALNTATSAGEPVLFQTSSTATTMVASHVYTITGVSTDATGTLWVTTYNPWGFFDTRTIADLRLNGIGAVVIGNT